MSAFPDGFLHLIPPIDRDTPVPYYHQIKEWFRMNVINGTLGPEQRLPSEDQLCQSFQVSRTVIRQALKDLVNEGLLYRRKGVGSFVAGPKIREGLVQTLTGSFEDMLRQGITLRSQVLEQRVIPATGMLAERLNLASGQPVVKIDRLRFVKNDPIVFVTTYLPFAYCPDLLKEDLTSQSLYAVLENKFGLCIVRGHRTLEAITANEQDAALLQVHPGAAIVLIRNISYLQDGRPIEYYEAKHRGDRSQFEAEVVRIHGSDSFPHSDAANGSGLPQRLN